ncbi:hypothetical protein ARMGADRAFT_1166856 [Armillaria gallica]|uniref:Uncharacterized protein n=1 Tax=Armillaria gallica TaxID=47427 RepID=A0A2H3D9G2_ARMGA|nr:hypothetical protein ARMGADRAFT_1166856 [Armillaria gallica]
MYPRGEPSIDLFGLENVTASRNRTIETPLNERDAMMLAYEGKNNHVAVTESVTAWRSAVTVTGSHAPPVHPFHSEQRLLAIPNDRPYIPPDVLYDAPALDPREYGRWFLLTLLGKPRYDDKERNIQRDDEARYHRAGRDEPTKDIYNNMPSASPSGLTTMMPSQSYPTSLPAPATPNGLSDVAAFDSRLRCWITGLVWSSKLMGTHA